MPAMRSTVTHQNAYKAKNNTEYLFEPNVSALSSGELPLMEEVPCSTELSRCVNACDVARMFSIWCRATGITHHDGFDISVTRNMFCARLLQPCLPNRPHYSREMYWFPNFSRLKPSKSREWLHMHSRMPELFGRQTTKSSYGYEYVENIKHIVKKKAIPCCFQSNAPKLSLAETLGATSSPLKDELDLFELPQNFSLPKGITGCPSNYCDSFPHKKCREYHEHISMSPLDLDALSLSECFGFPSQTQPVDHDHRIQLQNSTREECNKVVTIHRSLNHKYRPKSFDDLIGQDCVTRTLLEDIQKGVIAPVYLFQGSRGTGKTSVARIFATFLNCGNVEGRRPCGSCKECLAFTRGESLDIKEVDAASNNDIDKLKAFLQSMISSAQSKFKVYIVDECHMLTDETWTALLRFLDDPIDNVVLIFITTDPGKVPTMVVSRCKRMSFSKISEAEIVARLQLLANQESLDIEAGVLDVIARKSDGSLRDAEIMLDQLSLFDQTITFSKFHELFGSVAEEKLQTLLYYALCSDMVHTIQMARELIDSGVEPLDLTGQLVTLIRGLVKGNTNLSEGKQEEWDMERLQLALKILSDAEKHLREVTDDRITWLTAALLQFGPAVPCVVTMSSSHTNSARNECDGRRQDIESSNTRKYNLCPRQSNKGCAVKSVKKKRGSAPIVDVHAGQPYRNCMHVWFAKEYSHPKISFEKRDDLLGIGGLESIWLDVLGICKSPLKLLLQNHGNLAAISISADDATVFLEFRSPEHKYRSEQCRERIANIFEAVLGISVDVKINLSVKSLNHTISESNPHRNTNYAEQNYYQKHIDKNNFGSRYKPVPNDVTDFPTNDQLYERSQFHLQHNSMDGVDVFQGNSSGVQEIVAEKNVINEVKLNRGCCRQEQSSRLYNLEADELLLEPHSNYGGILCWKVAQGDDEMVSKNEYKQRGYRILTRLVPCGHA